MYIPLQSHLYCSLSSFLHVWNSQLFYLKQKFCWVRCVTCFVHPHSSGAFAWIYWTEKEPSNGHTKGKEEKKKENKEEFISLSLLSFSDSIRLFRALWWSRSFFFLECSSLLLFPVRYGRDKPRSDFRKDRSMTIRWWWCYLLINIVCVCVQSLSPLWGPNKKTKRQGFPFFFFFFLLSNLFDA